MENQHFPAVRLPTQVPALTRWQRLERHWAEEAPLGAPIGPLSDDELIQSFVKWGTPSGGQTYVNDARENSPSRKVQSKIGNVITRYTSRKMNRRLATESRRPEFGAVLRYDFDGVTHEIYCQPPEVRLSVPTERKLADGTITIYSAPQKYTPDILRLTAYGIFIDEWKTPRDLELLQTKYPGRFFQEKDGTWRCPEREAHFGSLGITYCMRSSDENNPTFVSNVEFLSDFLCDRAAPLTDSAWRAIETITGKNCPMTLGLLLTQAYPDRTPWNQDIIVDTPPGAFVVDDVYKAIAEQRLFVDLDFDDLSETEDVIVCSSRAQLDAVVFSRAAPRATSDEILLNVDIGTEFTFRDRTETFEVSMVNGETVHFFDKQSRAGTLMPVHLFEQALYRRDITLLSTTRSIDDVLGHIEGLTDIQIIEGKNRLLMVKAIEEGKTVRTNLSKRQRQRIVKSVREAGDSIAAQRWAATPKRRSGGRVQISEKQLALIRKVIEEGNNPTNAGGSANYKRYVRLSGEQDVHPASRKTFTLHAKEFVDKKARRGSRVVYAEAPLVWYLHLTDKVHGGRPFHRVHIDHTKLDVFVTIRGRGGRIFRRRPWLTLAIDAETRAVLGFYLSLHAPSTVSCMMVLRAIVKVHKRVPFYIVVDNGKEFHSSAFDALCDWLDVTLQFRPAHEARFGNVMERLFGTTNTELIHNLVGNTKALQNVRTVTKSVNPLNGKLMTFPELHGLLDHYFFQDYNQRVHPAHDHTPIEYMNRRLGQTGRRLARRVPFDGQFYIRTCIAPSTHGSTRVLDKQRGIKIGHIWYTCREFADSSLRNGQKLGVLVDMWDVSIAYAKVKGDWIRCTSQLLMRYRRLTTVEWRYVIYEVRLRSRGVDDEGMEHVLQSVLQDNCVPDAAALTEATRQVYGDARLIEDQSQLTTDQIISMPVALAMAEVAEDTPAPVFRNPVPAPRRDAVNASQDIFSIDYDKLPTRGRIQTGGRV
ncbi:DDE-type integrase/transposase/recombinase [Paraburkholderia mimosarum]|uniref:DDE-type integrase/transposase/recombinase n=1 Tax=Paraburkholderia mimosarum TaxID=312026 RepID=UPI000406C063|nr:DDE-type integrase/transposase/recombinase [Paraburkholderia mimosarum]